MLKKSASIILVIVMIVSVFTIIPFSASAETVWQVSNPSLESGSGTESDPYRIYSLEDLEKLRDNVNSGERYSGNHFKLMNDIVMNAYDKFTFDENGTISGVLDKSSVYQWEPIGTSINTTLWNATFDGNEKSIIGLYVDRSNYSNGAGLFSYLYNSTVENLSVVDGYIIGQGGVAGVVGESHENCAVIKCNNSCTIVGTSAIGGVVGSSNGDASIVTNCYNTGAIIGSGGSNIGGVVGSGVAGDCNNRGSVDGVNCQNVGGIVGSGSANNCYNTGSVTGNNSVGGIVGFGNNISYCYNTGSILGIENAGGVLGYSTSGSIHDSYNAGEVYGSLFVGGVVGGLNIQGGAYHGYFEMTTSYNVGNLTCNGNYLGGILGYIYSGVNNPYPFNPLLMQNCYYLDCTASINVGGMSDNKRAGTRTIENVIALSVEQMKNYVSFLGFDFDNTWFIGPNGYPALISLYDSYFTQNNRISISVIDENGDTVLSGYTVKWYEKGSDKVIGRGKTLDGMDKEKEYQFEVILGEELSYLYKQPAKQDAICDGTVISASLEKLNSIVLSGQAIDKEDASAVNATVTLKQIFNNQYAKETVLDIDENGGFSETILNVPTELSITSDGYYSQTKTVIEKESKLDTIDIGSIALFKLPENKIALQLTKVNAAPYGQIGDRFEITPTNNLRFSLYNQSQNKTVNRFTVQYPYIYLEDDEVNPKDIIEINVTDNDNQMTAPQQVFLLDSRKTGSCAVEFTENGKFIVPTVLGNDNNTIMLFDDMGKFMYSESVSSDYTSKPLPSGRYSVVLIQKTDLMSSVSTLSKLADFGMRENVDYILKEISISNGIVSVLDSINVPVLDESKLYYTVSQNTNFTANTASPYAGRYVMMRCEYQIDEKYVSKNETVTIELPDGVSFVKNSLTVNSKAKSYSIDDNKLIIPSNSNQAVIRFYVAATNIGRKDIEASLSFSIGDIEITQPIGTATFTAMNERIDIPEKTSQTEVHASGTTMAESTVMIFDNGVKVGTAKVNKTGKWGLAFELVEPGEYSYHLIYTVIENERLNTIVFSDPQMLIYNSRLAEVSSITMINNNNFVVFDYIHPNTVVPSYSYIPRYSQFTFKVDFKNADETLISDVYVVTENNNGEKTYIPVTYDDHTKSWIGTHNYHASGVPVSVSLEYTDLFSTTLSMTLEHLSGVKVFNERIDDDILTFDMNSGGSNYSVKAYPIDKVPSALSGNESDFEEINDETALEGLAVKYNEKNDTTVLVLADQYVVMQREYEDKDIASVGVYSDALVPTGRDVTRNGLGLNGVPAQEIARRVGKMLDDLEDGKCNVNGDLINPRTVQAMRANYRNRWIYNGASAALAAVNTVDTINSAGHLGDNFHASARGIAENQGFWAQAFSVVEPVLNIGTAIRGLLDHNQPYYAVRDQADANIRELLRLYGQLKLDFLCDPDAGNETPLGMTTYSRVAEVTPKIDPSGYVYEAVPSNRIEGVKVEAYYYDHAVDEFGIPDEQKSDILWDAENYDQVNPLYTDANGKYAWDVPMGQWLVKFSKDGYYDTDSKLLSMVDDDGYLPVPPPQTEVNVGMVSKAAPTVEIISVYEEEIRIEFSQYMQIDSVNNNTVTVKMNGKSVTGSIAPVNAEYDYEQKHQYASIFTFIPDSVISGRINVTVNDAVNYAGSKMTKAFTESNQVVAKPESLVIKNEISVAYNSGALLEIDVLPKEAGAGLSLDVSSSSPSIVEIANSNIVTDENGHANIMLLGNLPGEGEITVSLNGTDITKTVKASVAGVVSVSDRCEKVTANIASGKTVESGTMIELSTITEDAEIYYTVDGTCPCTVDSPSRIKYTEPIRITEDTFIIAYSVKDGMQESYTAGFNYFVPAPAVDVLLGDVDGDGTVTIIDATYIQRKLASIPIPFEINETIADTDDDGSITILDATFIQRWLASLPANDNIGKPIG